MIRRPRLVLAATAALLLVASASAQAAPVWKLDSVANTSAPRGGSFAYHIAVQNVGDEVADVTAPGQAAHITAAIPTGLSLNGAENAEGTGWDCSASTVAFLDCVDKAEPIRTAAEAGGFFPHAIYARITVEANAPEATLTTHFQLSGGGAAPVETVDPTLIAAASPAFGIDAFDLAAAADSAGTPATQAAGHPFDLTTDLDFNTTTNPRVKPANQELWPVAAPKDVFVDLPPGLLGSVASFPQCTISDLAHTAGILIQPLCVPGSQLGIIVLRFNAVTPFSLYVPVYNMIPPPGVAARFGFNAGGVLNFIDFGLHGAGAYPLTARVRNISEALPVAGSTLTVWGNPAAAAHDGERACPDESQNGPLNGGVSCLAGLPPTPLLRSPSSCTPAGQGLLSGVSIDSWEQPGPLDAFGDPVAGDSRWPSATSVSHQPPGYPYPPAEQGAPLGTEDCGAVPFEPALSVAPTTEAADSPSGLDVDLTLPQGCFDAEESPSFEAICQSDLRDVALKLPAGVSVNPAAAAGRGACSEAQIDLEDPGPASCPDDSKLGTVHIDTPLLDDQIDGNVYLAQQSQNKFGSLLALYLAIDDPETGTVVKLAGRVVLGAGGQLETVFSDNPQLPFSHLHLELFGGQRAALRTPAACGTYNTQATLTPWSGNAPVSLSSSFPITQGCAGGFDPKLEAGTQNPLAGTYSPFSLRLTREDATQEIGALSATLAPGLIGKPAGIPYCPDAALAAVSGALGTGAAQEHSPSCPAASQLGTVTVGAGAGLNPFYTSAGRAYLAGPYKGAPLSLAVVAPAVAGPFDFGSVVVRNALRIDPETTQVSAVSDPIPSILHGIPLDLRDVRVSLDRPDFTLNPTSCEPMSIDSTVTSTQGATAHPSSPFQAANCDKLGFKPKLSLKLAGGTKRSGHPALTAVLQARKGDANIAGIQVALPHSEFLAQSHIRTVCTRVQFAAGGGGGAACPAGSVYGKVSATSPLVDYPLRGNVYLRSSSHPLPDLVMALHGPPSQPLQVDAVGRIDSKGGGIRTTFETVPDAPLTKVVLSLPGGKKSLLENSRNLCKAPNKASVQMDAHNGKVNDFTAPLQAKCPKAKKAGKHRRR